MILNAPIIRKSLLSAEIVRKSLLASSVIRKSLLTSAIEAPSPPAFISAEVGLIDAYTIDILFDKALNESKIPDAADLIPLFSGGATSIYDRTITGLHLYATTGIYSYYLPSRLELSEMRNILHLSGIGGFSNVQYWSSTEYISSLAYSIDFTNGSLTAKAKTSTYRVRGIRTFTSKKVYALRDSGPSGGWIFYITDNGDDTYTYLECAPTDQSTSKSWSNITNVLVGGTSAGIGTGQANTTAIINQVGHTTSAAKLCDDLIIGRAITAGETGTIQYVPNALAAKKLTGTNGALVAAFTESVTNNVTATIPVLQTITVEDAAPTVFVLTYDIALDETSTPATTAFTIAGHTVASVLVTGLTCKVTVSERIYWGDSDTSAYTKPALNMIKSTLGGEADSFTSQAVTNNVALDSDASDYITTYSVTDTNQKKALDYLTKELKSESFWDDIVQILPMCNSMVGNLKNLALNATVYDDVGKRIVLDNFGTYNYANLIATGPTRYAHIKTGVIPSTHLTANNINVSLWMNKKPTTSESYEFGSSDGANGVLWFNDDANYFYGKYNLDAPNQIVYTVIANVFWHVQLNATANNRRDLFINGVSVNNDTATNNTNLQIVELALGGLLNGTGGGTYLTSYGYHGLLIIGKSIPLAREAVYHNIIDTFMSKKLKYISYFGDSITGGYGVADVNDSFPYKLSTDNNILKNTVNGMNGYRMQMVGNNDYSYYYDMKTKAGHPLDAPNKIYDKALGSKSGYAIFEYGVNDCGYNDVSSASGGTDPNTVELFTTHYQEILTYFINTLLYPANRIILLGLTYVNSAGWITYQTSYGSTPADSARVASFNAAISALCTANGCNYVELTDTMIAGGGDSLLQADGLHPNAAGHAFIAAQIAAQVTNFGI